MGLGVGVAADGLQHPADLGVGERHEPGVVLHEPGVEALLVRAQRVPRRDPPRARRVLGVFGDDPELELALEGLLAHRVPAMVELPTKTAHATPAARGAGRGRRRARSSNMTGLSGFTRLRVPHPADRPIDEVGVEVVALLRRAIGLHRAGVLEQHRVVLVRLARDEAVEVVEPEPGRPAIERADHARLPVRRVVILAEPRRVVAVVLQDPTDRRGRLRNHRGVAREPRRPFRHEPRPAVVMVPPGQQRGTRRPADRGGVEPVVPHARGRQTVQRRSRHRPAERADLTETDIVKDDHHRIRRARRRLRRPGHASSTPDTTRPTVPVNGGSGIGRRERSRTDVQGITAAFDSVGTAGSSGQRIGDLTHPGRPVRGLTACARRPRVIAAGAGVAPSSYVGGEVGTPSGAVASWGSILPRRLDGRSRR